MRRIKWGWLLVAVMVIIAAMSLVIVACAPEEIVEENEDEKPTLATYLAMVGAAMDETFTFNFSKQMAVDLDFDLNYDSTVDGKDWNYRVALKGNVAVGAERKDEDINDLALVVQKKNESDESEEIFRLSTDNENIFVRYGQSAENGGGYKNLRFTDAPLFDALRVLIPAVTEDLGTVDPAGILEQYLPMAGVIFDGEDYDFVDMGDRQYLTVKFDLGQIKTLVSGLLPLLGSVPGLEGFDTTALQDAYAVLSELIPDGVGKLTFELAAGKFVGVNVKDATVIMQDGSEQGVFNLKCNSLRIENSVLLYGADITPVPANIDEYTSSKIIATDLAGKVLLKDEKGETFSTLNWKVVANLDLIQILAEYFDLSAPTLKDNFLHIQLSYDYVEGNESYGNARLNKNMYLDNGSHDGSSSSIIDIMYDPTRDYNPGGIVVQANLSNLFTEEAVSGLKDYINAVDADQQMGAGGAWRLLSPLFMNTLTVDLDVYSMFNSANVKKFSQADTLAANAGDVALSAGELALAGPDIGGIFDIVKSAFSGDFNLGSILGTVVPMIPIEGVDLSGVFDANGINLKPLYDLVGNVNLEGLPLDVGAVVRGLFAGDGVEAASLGFTVERGNLLSDAADMLFDYDVWSNAFLEPADVRGVRREKVFNQGNFLPLTAYNGTLGDIYAGDARVFYNTVGGSPIEDVSFTSTGDFLTYYRGVNYTDLNTVWGNSYPNMVVRPVGNMTDYVMLNQGAGDATKYISVQDLPNLRYVQANYTMSLGATKTFSNYLEVVGYDGLSLDPSMYGVEQEFTLYLNIPETAGVGLLGFLASGGMVNITGLAGGSMGGQHPMGIDKMLDIVTSGYRVQTKMIIYNKVESYSGLEDVDPKDAGLVNATQNINEEIVVTPGLTRTTKYIGQNGEVVSSTDTAITSLSQILNWYLDGDAIVDQNGIANNFGSSKIVFTLNGKEYSSTFSVPYAAPTNTFVLKAMPEVGVGAGVERDYTYEYHLLEGTTTVYVYTSYTMNISPGWGSYGWSSMGKARLFVDGAPAGSQINIGPTNTWLYDWDKKEKVPRNVSAVAKYGVVYDGSNVDGSESHKFTFPNAGVYYMYCDAQIGGRSGFVFRIIVGEEFFEYNIGEPDENYEVDFTFTKAGTIDVPYTITYTNSSNFDLLVDGEVLDAENNVIALTAAGFTGRTVVFKLVPKVGAASGYHNVAVTLTGDLTGDATQVITFEYKNVVIGLNDLSGAWLDESPDYDAVFTAWTTKVNGTATKSYVRFGIVYKTVTGVVLTPASYDLVANVNGGNRPNANFELSFNATANFGTPAQFKFDFTNNLNLVVTAEITAYVKAAIGEAGEIGAVVFTKVVNIAPVSDDDFLVLMNQGAGTYPVNRPTMANTPASGRLLLSENGERTGDLEVSVVLEFLNNSDAVVNSAQALPYAEVSLNGRNLRYGVRNSNSALSTRYDYVFSVNDAAMNNGVLDFQFNNAYWYQPAPDVLARPNNGSNYKIRAKVNVNGVEYVADIVNPNVLKKGSACVVEGTLVMLADGSQVPVETLQDGDALRVWNLFTGAYDSASMMYMYESEYAYYDLLTLNFSDGTKVSQYIEHGYFSLDRREFVYINNNSVSEFIGERFQKMNADGTWAEVVLMGYVNETKYTRVYSPNTANHFNYYVNGILSVSELTYGMATIFEVDENLKYNETAMATDIEKYGLCTYEEAIGIMEEIALLTEDEFYNDLSGLYMKVALGKGELTLQQLLVLFSVFYKADIYSNN